MTDAGAGQPVYEWRSFEVGERVRVRLSGECVINLCHPRLGGADGTILWHVADEDGITGWVVDTCDLDHHCYIVKFDRRIQAWEPYPSGAGMFVMAITGRYAASELEPVARPPDRGAVE